MAPLLLQGETIVSLINVVGVVQARTLAARFRNRIREGSARLSCMSVDEAKLEAHSLRGSALLLGMRALAEHLLAVEENGDWRAHEQSVHELSTKSLAELERILDEHG